jgi:hypothetical protein
MSRLGVLPVRWTRDYGGDSVCAKALTRFSSWRIIRLNRNTVFSATIAVHCGFGRRTRGVRLGVVAETSAFQVSGDYCA